MLNRESRREIGILVCKDNLVTSKDRASLVGPSPGIVKLVKLDSSTEYLPGQVKNLSVAKEMVKSMAVEAQAAREANGLLIMQNGEGTCLEKIK